MTTTTTVTDGLSQPSPQAFSAGSFLDSTMSCDVTERYSPRISGRKNVMSMCRVSKTLKTSRGQRSKRERLGTRLGLSIVYIGVTIL